MPKDDKKTTTSRKAQRALNKAERRSGKDRRKGIDRRLVDIPVPVDRRSGKDRRSPVDRRQCPLS